MTSRRIFQLLLATVPATVFAVQVSGCTLLGLGVGAVADGARKDRTPRSILRIQRGSSLELHLRDGSTVRGWFEGRSQMTPPAYAHEWATWQGTAPSELGVPSPGDSITLVREDGTSVTGTLVVYQLDGVLVAPAGGVVSVESIRSLSTPNGRNIDGGQLRSLTEASGIPLSTMIRVRTQSGVVETPINAVSRVEGPAPRGGKIVGFLVGLSADFVVVAAAAATASSSSCGSVGYSY